MICRSNPYFYDMRCLQKYKQKIKRGLDKDMYNQPAEAIQGTIKIQEDIMKKKKFIAVMTAGVLAATALAGCSSPKTEEATAAAESSEAANSEENSEKSEALAESETADAEKNEDGNEELKEINIVLDWYPNAIHTFIYTAIERGYYAEEGIKVNIQFPSNSNDALSLVAAGKAEVGMYYQHDLIQAVANQNIGIKSIGAITQSPLDVVLSLKDKNITSPKDLEGKLVGYAGTALSEAFIKTMMEADGADFSKTELVDVGFELMSSMTTDNVDATIGCMLNHEVPQLEEEGFEVNHFLVEGYGIPDYYELILLSNNDTIENDPELLAGFLRASKKGFEDFKADPYGCLEILLNNQNEENFPLSETVEKKSSDTLLPVMETADAKFLSQSDEVWQKNIDWMLETGLIDNSVDVSDVKAYIEY